MALKIRINDDLKAALLSGNRFEGEVLRGLKAAILNEEVAENKREEGLDDSIVEKIIAREVKKRNESALIYDDAGRPDMADNERKEMKIIKAYLPTQIPEIEISKCIEKIIGNMGVSGPSAMGQVIGATKKELGNSADGAIIAKLVKDALK